MSLRFADYKVASIIALIMLKLLLHITVAAGLWWRLSALNVNVGMKVLGIALGAIAVHVVWRRIFSKPYAHFGVRSFDAKDPLILEALEQAKATFPKFCEIYPEHRTDSVVRFRFQTDANVTEHLWGDLVEINDREAKIYLRTPPVDHQGRLERAPTIPWEEINDWQVEFRDGTLRGGFTNRAMFKIVEREEGSLPAELEVQRERFRDIDW